MQNFIYFLIRLQNKILKKTTSNKSTYLGLGATLNINSETNKTKQKIEQDIIKLIKENKSTEDLIQHIEEKGTKVHRIKNAQKRLQNISQEYGFIPKTKGIKAILINLVISVYSKEKVQLKQTTQPMFIIDRDTCDKYWLIQQIYKWYSSKANMPGYDIEVQENFNSLMLNNNRIKVFNMDELLSIKDAISRDRESIDFIMELAKTTIDSKMALSKVKSGGACV